MFNQTSISQQPDSNDEKDAFLFSLEPKSRVVWLYSDEMTKWGDRIVVL